MDRTSRFSTFVLQSLRDGEWSTVPLTPRFSSLTFARNEMRDLLTSRSIHRAGDAVRIAEVDYSGRQIDTHDYKEIFVSER